MWRFSVGLILVVATLTSQVARADDTATVKGTLWALEHAYAAAYKVGLQSQSNILKCFDVYRRSDLLAAQRSYTEKDMNMLEECVLKGVSAASDEARRQRDVDIKTYIGTVGNIINDDRIYNHSGPSAKP